MAKPFDTFLGACFCCIAMTAWADDSDAETMGWDANAPRYEESSFAFEESMHSPDHRDATVRSFLTTLPMLAASHQTRDRAGRRHWMLLSALPGIAQIDEPRQFLSGIAFGWGLAYTASRAMSDDGSAPSQNVQFGAGFVSGEPGLYLHTRW